MTSQELREIVEHLSSYPTRNSLSPYLRPAMEWVAEQYGAIPGMEVELMEFTLPVGNRVPEPTPVVQVIATLPGERPELVMQSAHVDSLCLGVDPKTGRAPGANDDSSGVAVGICVARALAAKPRKNTLRFVAYCGEEQGLLGAKALSARAKDEDWPILGILNNDMVGSSRNLNGQSEANALRLYSDLPAREFARFAEWVVRQNCADFRLKMHLRPDRFGRGGDHTPFANLGFPAVRLTEVYEEWAHQHTPEDTIENMDFDFLARSAEANRVVMDALSKAEPAPTNVRFDPKASYHTILSWEGESSSYEVFWRETSSATWQGSQPVKGNQVEMKNLNKDEYIFGVAAENGVPVEAQVAT
ncbi:MAG: M28 family metallopeptidase [Chthonomonas sp.]|nr:M28 family metallopeptidase [Chthonomonas sp.]